MDNRNRNTALVLIAAGLFLLLGRLLGFFAISSLVVVALGIYKIRESGDKSGYIILIVGLLMLMNSGFAIAILMILLGIGYFYYKSRKELPGGALISKHKVLESIRLHKDPWVLKDLGVWFVIGEANMDLSLAIAEEKETTLILQGVIADIDLFIPEDWGVSINASVLFGQIVVGKEKEAGALNKMIWTSPNYSDCDHKLVIELSCIVGDIHIKRL